MEFVTYDHEPAHALEDVEQAATRSDALSEFVDGRRAPARGAVVDGDAPNLRVSGRVAAVSN